ncbi:MAG: GNAT family N-acetyltransferase [Isosphaeraceae bacterium]|nr:GNAT family N-acetyltransferase [Isosphaeraceae bacterium]
MSRPPDFAIRRLDRLEGSAIDTLADVLIDCVEGGASVGFMHPLAPERARSFWSRVASDLERGSRCLLAAEVAGAIVGTVQLVLDLPENQPHRADLVKMLVHRRARRMGVASALLRAIEEEAVALGRTLLVLDAVTDGPAALLYERAGWIRVGPIPRFALMPDGAPCGTTFYYRDLSQSAQTS